MSTRLNQNSLQSESCEVPEEPSLRYKTPQPTIKKEEEKREIANKKKEPSRNGPKHPKSQKVEEPAKVESLDSETKRHLRTFFRKRDPLTEMPQSGPENSILVNFTKRSTNGRKVNNLGLVEDEFAPAKIVATQRRRNYAQRLAELEQKSEARNWVMMISLVLALNFYGYNMVIGNVMVKPLTKYIYHLDEKQQKEVNGQFGAFFALGFLFSSLNIGFFTKYIGRVKTMLLMEVIKIVLILCFNIKNLNLFLALRIATGFIAGLQSAVGPLTGNEMMPKKIALVGGGMFFFTFTLFILVAGSIHDIFGGEKGLADNWRLVLTWPIVFCFVTIIAILSTVGFSETPDYYIENVKDEKEMKEKIFNTMKKIYTEDSAKKFIEIKLKQMIKQKKKATRTKNALYMNWKTIFSKSFRYQFIAGALICILKELSGNMFMLYFSTQVFDEVSGNGAQITLILSLGMFIGAFISIFVIQFGRRLVMLFTSFIHAISLVALIIGIRLQDPLINSISSFFYITSFGCGLCSVLGIYVIEIMPAFGVGVTFAVQWLIVMGIGACYSYLMEAIGTALIMCIHLFFACCLFFSIYFLCYETKGHSKEEIQLIFMSGKLRADSSEVSLRIQVEKKKSKKEKREIYLEQKVGGQVVGPHGIENGKKWSIKNSVKIQAEVDRGLNGFDSDRNLVQGTTDRVVE